MTTETALAGLAAEFWDAYLAWKPIFATSVGERAYDPFVDDRSPESIAAHEARLSRLLGRVRAATDDGDPTTRSALVEQIEWTSPSSPVDWTTGLWTRSRGRRSRPSTSRRSS